MGRQPLWRRVNFLPQATYFKPAGVPLARLHEIRLSVEEAEAIRLKDLEGLEQEECAGKMNISRATFARELNSGRRKVAAALIQGQAIRIEGGNFEVTRRFRCVNGHEWDVPPAEISDGAALKCPVCNTSDVTPVWPSRPGRGTGGGHGRGGR